MPEPGVSEILNFNADAERATGTPAVVYDNTDLIRMLNSNANQKAEMDWRKYNMFLGNLKDVYKDLNEIAKQDGLTEDRDALKEKMAGVLKEISSDPRSFFGGGAKYQEILGKVTQLQTEATESKQNSLYDKAHRQYFYANPELDTEENRALMDQFRKQPLGSRQPYLMKLPGLFDPKSIADQLNIVAKEDYSSEKLTPDEKSYETITGVRYNPEKYSKLAEAFFNDSDKRGVPLRNTLTKRFDQLPAEAKEKYSKEKDPVKAFYMDMMSSYILPGSEKKSLNPNPNYLKREELAARERDSKRDYAASTGAQAVQMWVSGFEPDGKGGWKRAAWARDWSKEGGDGAGNLVDEFGVPKEGVDYWSTQIVPQLSKLKGVADGDVEIMWSEVSGLGMALEGETNREGKKFSVLEDDGTISKDLQPKIRIRNGVPVGVVIGDKYYDKNEINFKAINAANRSVSQKQDINPISGK